MPMGPACSVWARGLRLCAFHPTVSRLSHVETAFAMTIHKSQGSEFAHTVVALPDGGSDILTRELVCTGITRAREHLTVVEPRAGLLGDALARQVKRASGLSFS